MTEKPRPYKWAEFSDEIQRLENQAKGFEGILNKELEILKLTPNMKILDAGCGTGPVTRTMAKLIAPGNAYGMDPIPLYIDSAKKLAENEGIRNTRFELGNIQDMKYEDDFFDLTYCRLVMMHVNDTVKSASEMARVTKKGGIVAVSDMDDGGIMVFPPCPTFTNVMTKFLQWRKEEGENRNIGRELYSILSSAGLSDIKIYPFPIHANQGNPLAFNSLMSVVLELGRNSREGMIKSGWTTEEEMEEYDKELSAHMSHPGAFFMITLFFATGVA